MKTFIAYRSTGEDQRVVEPLLTAIRDAFKDRGIEAYCTFFDEAMIKDKSLDARQIMEHAFGIIDVADFLFVIQTSDSKSEGMLVEIGYCLAKKIPIIVATKDTITKTHVPRLASQSFTWSTVEGLTAGIADLKL